MKRFLVHALMIFVIGFAGNAFAIQAEIPSDYTTTTAKGGTQIIIGGEILMRGTVIKNTDNFGNNGANSGSQAAGAKQSSRPASAPKN